MATGSLTGDCQAPQSRQIESLALLGVPGILVILLVPMPSISLDILLLLDVGLATFMLLMALRARNSHWVSAFPSLLLLLALYRLSINVATTRLILLDGDAGFVVSAFGEIIVGNNWIVGTVIFLLLIVIHFMAVTCATGRITEIHTQVASNDLSGKRAAIDASLRDGIIDGAEAAKQRAQLKRESEFYDGMEGTSKLACGEAIAGLVIMSVNFVGGATIGMSQGLSMQDAVQTYGLLTIGDGLMFMIPTLIIATTAGIIVTQLSTSQNLDRKCGTRQGGSQSSTGLNSPDYVVIEVGAGLESLIEAESKSCQELVKRIEDQRHGLVTEHRFEKSSFRILVKQLLPNTRYQVSINGRILATGEIQPHHFLAIDDGRTSLEIDGITTTEPASGLPAKWIERTTRHRAELGGYIVVDASTALLNHLDAVLKKNCH